MLLKQWLKNKPARTHTRMYGLFRAVLRYALHYYCLSSVGRCAWSCSEPVVRLGYGAQARRTRKLGCYIYRRTITLCFLKQVASLRSKSSGRFPNMVLFEPNSPGRAPHSMFHRHQQKFIRPCDNRVLPRRRLLWY